MSDEAISPWAIAEQDFPRDGTPEEQVRFLLGYAILAPSSHNTQPWHFRVGPSSVEVLADRSRDLKVVDPDGRELTISCGAALFHLQLAMGCFGFQTQTELLPDPQHADLLARVAFAPCGTPSAEERSLFAAIPRRLTNRSAFSPEPVPDPLIGLLRAAAEAEGAWFHSAESDDERAAIADLIAEGDRQQWGNPAFRRELASWMRADHSSARDGMPGYGFGMGEVESLAAPLLIRTFDMGSGRAAKDEELALGSPELAVLGTARDTPEAWLAAGVAVERVLLRATADGLSYSFLNQSNEIPALRARLREVIGQAGWPQMLMRFGYGPKGWHSPRRPVAEVLRD